MATETVPATPEPLMDKKQLSRSEVGMEATYEIDSIINMLLREHAEGTDFEFLIRSSLRRISVLNGVSMSALGGDDGRSTQDMLEAVWMN